MKRLFLILSIIIMWDIKGFSSEVMPWVISTSIGGVNLTGFYSISSQEINFNIEKDTVNLNGITFTDEAIYPIDSNLATVAAKVSIRPGIGFDIFVKAGMVKPLLKKQTPLATKKWKTDNYDYFYGCGGKYVVAGDMILLPQIAIELGINNYNGKIEQYSYLGEKTPISQRLSILQFQGSLIISKSFLAVTPYGGIKFFYTKANWEDKENGSTIKGSKTGYSPFIGLSYSVLPFMNIKLETSFIDEISYAGGLSFNIGI